jgi:hypothetical protein
MICGITESTQKGWTRYLLLPSTVPLTPPPFSPLLQKFPVVELQLQAPPHAANLKAVTIRFRYFFILGFLITWTHQLNHVENLWKIPTSNDLGPESSLSLIFENFQKPSFSLKIFHRDVMEMHMIIIEIILG